MWDLVKGILLEVSEFIGEDELSSIQPSSNTEPASQAQYLIGYRTQMKQIFTPSDWMVLAK